MVSRYDSLDKSTNALTDFNQTEQTTQTTQTSQNMSESGSRNSSSTTNESAVTQFNIDTMSSPGRQALNQLLAQLAAGGTDEQRRNLEEQLRTLQSNRAAQADYSRETALGDAEGLVQRTLQRALEQALPSILLAGSGAGTSGSAISALLTQDLAARAAREAAGVGVNAVQGYGGILAQLMGQEAQTALSMEDQATAALIEALGVDSQSMKRGSQTTNSTSTTNARETSSRNQNTSGSSTQIGTSILNRTPNATTRTDSIRNR